MEVLSSAISSSSVVDGKFASLCRGSRPTVLEDRNLVAGKWRVGQRLGSGSFGTVYKASGIGCKTVAIKMERLDNKSSTLRNEARMYKILHGTSFKPIGIPKVQFYRDNGNQGILVMDYLGDSLEKIMSIRGGKLSTTCVLEFGLQALERIQFVHGRGLLHRDIRPANIVVGKEGPKTLYLIDLGLSKRYCDPDTGEHIPNRTNRLAGTLEYLSLSSHEGKGQSRRDDLESLGFTLVYLHRGSLPWSGIRNENVATKNMVVLSIKRRVSVDTLCQNLPEEMKEYFAIVRKLSFQEMPDYTRLKSCFLAALARTNN